MAEQPPVSDVLNSITSDIKTIVRGEIDLAKAEMVPQVKRAGIGVGMFGAAGYLALHGALLLFVALGIALTVLPGPLTIPPVLLGLWVWSTEFEWARRFFAAFSRKARDAWQHARQHPHPALAAVPHVGRHGRRPTSRAQPEVERCVQQCLGARGDVRPLAAAHGIRHAPIVAHPRR